MIFIQIDALDEGTGERLSTDDVEDLDGGQHAFIQVVGARATHLDQHWTHALQIHNIRWSRCVVQNWFRNALS